MQPQQRGLFQRLAVVSQAMRPTVNQPRATKALARSAAPAGRKRLPSRMFHCVIELKTKVVDKVTSRHQGQSAPMT